MSLESRGRLAAERSPRRFTVIAVVVGAVSLLGCGSAGKLTCSDDASCGAGRRCARTVVGESKGVCVANYQLAIRSPADQALLTAGSVPISVNLTLASADQPAPQTVDLFVDGTFAQALNLTARAGSVASYGGVVTLGDGQTVSLEVVAARGTLDEVSAGPVRVTGQSIKPPPPPGGGGGGVGGGGGGGMPSNPPVVTSVVLVCQAQACVRDEVVSVTATVENGPASVRVRTDLALDRSFSLTSSGGGTSYSGTIPLAALPFPVFTEGVSATVEALDSSGTVVSSSKAGVAVTRLRWAYAAGAAVTSPAVMDDGTLVVGRSQTTGQVLALRPNGTQAWATTLEAHTGAGGGFVTSAPAAGKKAIWVGSDDGRVYGISTSGGGLVANGVCPDSGTSLTAAHLFTPLVYQLPSAPGAVPEEVAYAGGATSYQLGLAPSASSACAAVLFPSSSMSVHQAPVMNSKGDVFVGVSIPSLNREIAAYFAVNAGSPGQLDYRTSYDLSGSALAIGLDWSDALLVADRANEVNELVLSTNSTKLNLGWSAKQGSVDYGLEAMVVSSVGEPIIGGKLAGLGRVDRLTSAGKLVQDWPVSLGAGSTDVTGLALAALNSSGVVIYATTSSGDLFALDQNGAVVWSTHSGSSQLLGTDRLDFPTIAPPVSGQSLPTLYAGSADGHLYAVVVDSGLDPAAPWPKAHHDLRNTGNAMAVRP